MSGGMQMSTIDKDLDRDSASVDFPPRIFLYTLDQIATALGTNEATIRRNYIYFEGRSRKRVVPLGLMTARNIAPGDQPPEWRVAENELVRWMKHKGFLFVTSSRLLK